MKKSAAYLPELKQDEVKLIALRIRALCEDVRMVILFGSYACGDCKDGQLAKSGQTIKVSDLI